LSGLGRKLDAGYSLKERRFSGRLVSAHDELREGDYILDIISQSFDEVKDFGVLDVEKRVGHVVLIVSFL
jgi:hypothetical protein